MKAVPTYRARLTESRLLFALGVVICAAATLFSIDRSARAQSVPPPPAPPPPSLNEVIAAKREAALKSGEWYIINGITCASAIHLPALQYRVTAPLEFVDYQDLQLHFEPGAKVYPTWTDPGKDVLRFVGCNNCRVQGGQLDTRAGPVRRWLAFERNERGWSANHNSIVGTFVEGHFADAGVHWSGNELGLIDYAHLQSFTPAPALRIDQGPRTMQCLRVKDTLLRSFAAGPFLHIRNGTVGRMSDILFDGAATCWASNGPIGNAGVLIECSGEIRQLVFRDIRSEANASWHQFLVRAAPGHGVNMSIEGGSFHQMRKLVQAVGVDLTRCSFRNIDAYSQNYVEQVDAAGVTTKVATWTIPLRPFIECGRLIDCEIDRVGIFTWKIENGQRVVADPGACNLVYRTQALPAGVAPTDLVIR